MAELAYSAALEDPLKKKQDQVAQSGIVNAGDASSGIVGGGGAVANTAGVGAGGQGAWTNIQAYLNANKKDTATASFLDQKVGSQLDQEKSLLDQSVDEKKTEADSQVNNLSQTRAGADDTIKKAAQAYQWEGTQSDPYAQNTSKIRDALGAKYTGPSNFAYGYSAPTENYRAALSNDQGFKQVLDDSYRERAGGNLTGGQLALQRQLDTTNDNLANTRTSLLSRMSGLDSYRDEKAADADTYFRGAAERFGNEQTGLRDDLGRLQNEADTRISQAEADARAGYSESLKGKSGAKSAKWDNIHSLGGSAQADYMRDSLINTLTNRDVWGDNLSYGQLETEQQLAPTLRVGTGDNLVYFDKAPVEANAATLNAFYGEQDEKYKDTADADERYFNTITDILNSNNRKERGFKVRG